MVEENRLNLNRESVKPENWNSPPLWPLGYGETLTSLEIASIEHGVSAMGLLVLRACPDQYLPPNPPDPEAAWRESEGGPQCMLVFKDSAAVRMHVVRLLNLADAMDAEAPATTPPPAVE